MNRKVLVLLGVALLVLLVGRATRHDHRPPALPVSSGGWTAARSGGAVVETGSYGGMQIMMTAANGGGDVGLDITGNAARLPAADQVEFHGTFDDHASFAFVGDGSDGDLQSSVDGGQLTDWLRHMAAGGSLVISFDDQSAAPIVFPLAGATPTLQAWSAAMTADGGTRGFYGWHGPDAVAGFLGLSITSLFLLMAVMYFLPAVVAYARHSTQAGLILVFNLLAGWTVIGWCVLLLIALLSPTWGQVGRQIRRS